MIQVLRSLVPSNVWVLLFTETVVVVCCFVAACFLLLPADPVVYLLYDGGMWRVAVMTVTILLTLYFHDLYTTIRVRSRILLTQQVLQAVGVSFLFQALMYYTKMDITLPRWIMITGSGLSLVCIVAWRIIYGGVVLRGFGQERLLFCGSNDLVVELVRHVAEHPDQGLAIIGYVDEKPRQELEKFAPWLGSVKELRRVAEETHPDQIVVGMTERRESSPMADLLELRFSGMVIQEAEVVCEGAFKRVPLANLKPARLIYSGSLGPRPATASLQNLYSRLIALVGLLLCSPLMLIITLAVKLSSHGPALFRQTRVGWQERSFTLYKFRSMRDNAEAETGAVWASKDDPRVTALGRWLRRLRLDELPQLWNVLRGEMSLVGPRPERPEFVETLVKQIPFYRQRFCVRPGITGWAQINHKYGDTTDDAARKLELDLYYIKNLSPSLDAYIIVQTLKTVLLQRGAQ
jgi:exopolysaccharide biosynthesis polyprenyl glycosylphosphotransferase